MTASAGPVLKRLHREFGERVAFLTLYVREAHPGDHYPQPESYEDKLAHASAYRERDGLPWPVAVDDVEGTLHRALDARPNAAYLVDERGTVVYRALWSNQERVLREGLGQVAAGHRGVIGEREPRMVPMMTGMGKMYEILSLAGPVARRDVARKLPPMYGLARLAAVFRPLSPFARAMTATALALAALALLVVAVMVLL